MNGDVIFDKNTGSQNPAPPSPTGAVPSTEIPLNQLPHTLSAKGPVVKPTGPPPPPGRFPSGLLVKIAIGVVALFIILFLAVGVIMPMLNRSDKEEQEVTLTYWGLWESENTMNVMIKDFEKDHPKIKVKYIKQDPVKYTDKLKAQIGTDSGPDIFRYHNTWVPLLQQDLLPLSEDVITPEAFKEAYFPVVYDDLASTGPIYGVPLGIDTLALFVNPEITRDFDVPKDWNDFGKVAAALTVIGGDGRIETAGAALGAMDNVTHAPDILSMMMVQGGVDLYGDVDSDQSLRAIASALDFYTSFSSGQGKVWDDTMETSLDAFAKEKLAMYFGYSWDIFSIRAKNPDLQFEVHPVPGVAGGQNVTVASYWAEGVSAKSTKQDAALEFMKYLARKETLQKLYEAQSRSREFGELYPMKSLADSLKSNKLLYPFVEQAADAQSTYFVSDTHDNTIDRQMNNYLLDAVNAVTKDDTSSETAAETLVKGINTVRAQYDF